ncbi:MAG: alpha/beta fold hydrolase, partial [Acidimicrobiales bacterium]
MTTSDPVYDEFGMFQENAEEAGIPWRGAPVVVRRTVEVRPGYALSALVWGDGPREVVLVHGAGQNAHTWDSVALALDRPLVAVDLPGHGHSARPAEHRVVDPWAIAGDLDPVVDALAPRARVVVGMSLGGLATLAWAAR